MITSSVCCGFYTTGEGFPCTDFGCSVQSALLEEISASLFFLLFFWSQYAWGIRAWTASHLVDSSCLSGWEGSGCCARGSVDGAQVGLGFPCQPFLLCHPEPALYSCHFHPHPAPLPFLAIPSPPALVGGVWLPFPSQGGSNSLRREFGSFVLWASRRCRWGFAALAPLCPCLLFPKNHPRSCGWQSCVALAVLYLVFGY